MDESTVTYQIWSEVGGLRRRRHPDWNFTQEKGAWVIVDEYNAEEAENAAMEMRPVRTRFFVVKATTTHEEMTR